MTLRHLRIFVAVAESLNMHAAAKQLYIAQPAISEAISELENRRPEASFFFMQSTSSRCLANWNSR